MHNHYHSHCHHNLKYCEHCDIVYCTSCSREWGVRSYHYVSPYIWYYYNTPYTVRWQGDSYSITTNTGATVSDTNIISAFYGSDEYKKSKSYNGAACTHN